MSSPTLLIDSSFLAHRAFHTPGTAALSYKGKPTGVVYGFLRQVRTLLDQFQTDKVVFFFEFGVGKRQLDYPWYKAGRGRRDADFDRQVFDLYQEHLPMIGFRNIHRVEGYEADDLIANHCGSSRTEEVIVSADKDLWQCLWKNVSAYNPVTKSMMTRKRFIDEWVIPPYEWPVVKALAGCASDEVVGVPGVGEKTAARYVARKLGKDTAAFKKIALFKTTGMYQDNLRLVNLPYDYGSDLPYNCPLRADAVTAAGWARVMAGIGAQPFGPKRAKTKSSA